MFFHSFAEISRTVLSAIIIYPTLILMLRISGKRTLAKMNAFDLVVTVAIGSILATIILSKEVALAEGVAALVCLVGLQFVVTWMSVRSETIRKVVRAEPSLLLYQGELLRHELRRQRVTEAEIWQAIRTDGGSPSEAMAVVLETDGSFSVFPAPPNQEVAEMADVTPPAVL